MTIASEITRINGNITAAYTACNNKGATMPVTQNSANLATCIGSISGGGSSPVISSLTVTPTTSQQTITVPSGTDGYSPITVNAVTSSIDSNIVAGNIKKDVAILGVTGTYEGSGGQTGKYQLLDRVKDDSNNEIGSVCGFFTDANDTEYAVVCLDARYRKTNTKWSATRVSVTNLAEYSMNGAGIDLSSNKYTDTATSNCDKILAWCSAGGYTSDAVSHCRSNSFIIGGTTYYGQLPNLCELFDICANRAEISNADISKSMYSYNDIASWLTSWSSSQYNSSNAWYIPAGGYINIQNKQNGYIVIPVLEIPNAL